MIQKWQLEMPDSAIANYSKSFGDQKTFPGSTAPSLAEALRTAGATDKQIGDVLRRFNAEQAILASDLMELHRASATRSQALDAARVGQFGGAG
jgi:hypothetical protein